MHSIDYTGLPFDYEYIDGDPELEGSIFYSIFPLDPLRVYMVGNKRICLRSQGQLPEQIQHCLENGCYPRIRKMVNEVKKKPREEMAHGEAKAFAERVAHWQYWL